MTQKRKKKEVGRMSRPLPSRHNVTWPVAGMIVGSIIALATAPAVWVFADQLLDPGAAPEEIVPSIVQLAIVLLFVGFGSGWATWRYRVSVDGTAHTVTWTKSIYGVRFWRETWQRNEIESITVQGPRLRGFSVYLVGSGGRRPMDLDIFSGVDLSKWEASALALGVPYCDERDPPIPAPKPTWLSDPKTVWQLLAGLLITSALVTFLFWLRLGELGVGLGMGVAGFLCLIIAAIWYSDRVPADVQAPKLRPSRFDGLGAVWLLAIPFGPFLGWSATEQLTAENWQLVAGIRAFLCVALPAVCVLPLVRYVRGRYAVPAGAILLIGTTFPFILGSGAALDFVRGPVWQNVKVKSVRASGFTTQFGTQVTVPQAFADLIDGRTLRPVSTVDMHSGPARVLVLQGLNRIIDVEQ
jgi:hypothetical protein